MRWLLLASGCWANSFLKSCNDVGLLLLFRSPAQLWRRLDFDSEGVAVGMDGLRTGGLGFSLDFRRPELPLLLLLYRFCISMELALCGLVVVVVLWGPPLFTGCLLEAASEAAGDASEYED